MTKVTKFTKFFRIPTSTLCKKIPKSCIKLRRIPKGDLSHVKGIIKVVNFIGSHDHCKVCHGTGIVVCKVCNGSIINYPGDKEHLCSCSGGFKICNFT